MKNIIKSQLFQLKKDRFSILLSVAFIAVMLALMATTIMVPDDKFSKTGSVHFCNMIQQYMMFTAFFVMIITPHLCGSDFRDKTNYYELMSGHTRFEVFFGRVIVTAVYTLILSMIMVMFPVIVETIRNGWGAKISVRDAVMVYALFVFPCLRIICEFIFLSFVIRNPYIVMIIGYLIFMLAGSLMPTGYILGLSNINLLATIDIWAIYGLDQSINYIYETTVNSETVVFTIISSLIAGAGSLFHGYTFFKKDDLN